MANTGPAKIIITAEDVKKFQAILKLPTAAAKSEAQKALSPQENVKFVKYVTLLKEKQELKKGQEKEAALAAHQQETQARLKDAEARLAALKLEEAALVQKDKAILTQASSKFASKLDSFTREKPAVKTAVTTGAPTLKY